MSVVGFRTDRPAVRPKTRAAIWHAPRSPTVAPSAPQTVMTAMTEMMLAAATLPGAGALTVPSGSNAIRSAPSGLNA